MIVLIVFIVDLETGHFHIVLVNLHACIYMYRLDLGAQKIKIKTRKEELVYASTVSMKSSIILKDSLII